MAGVNPYLKNFFFMAFRSQRVFKNAEKEIGKIKTISIIITPTRTYMRPESATESVEVDFTEEEKKKLLKTFKVKDETVAACNKIFVMGDFEKKNIYIRQFLKDGTKHDITI